MSDFDELRTEIQTERAARKRGELERMAKDGAQDSRLFDLENRADALERLLTEFDESRRRKDEQWNLVLKELRTELNKESREWVAKNLSEIAETILKRE